MRIDPASDKPIFLQIAEGLEDDIFTGIFEEVRMKWQPCGKSIHIPF